MLKAPFCKNDLEIFQIWPVNGTYITLQYITQLWRVETYKTLQYYIQLFSDDQKCSTQKSSRSFIKNRHIRILLDLPVKLLWSSFVGCVQFRSSKSSYMYSEKATKFCDIFTLLLSYVVPVKSKVKILQNFVDFSEYMNFKSVLKVYEHDLYASTIIFLSKIFA